MCWHRRMKILERPADLREGSARSGLAFFGLPIRGLVNRRAEELTVLFEPQAADVPADPSFPRACERIPRAGTSPSGPGACWPPACRAAQVPGRYLPDCRRTAARNFVRAGVPERVAMALLGHKTRSMCDRYNIVCERELSSGRRAPPRLP